MFMSYCRFEGTQQELASCLNEAYDHYYEEAEYEVSESEIKCFKEMVHGFVNFLHNTGLLNEAGEVSENALEDLCEKMQKSFAEDND